MNRIDFKSNIIITLFKFISYIKWIEYYNLPYNL